MRILLADDERDLVSCLAKYLSKAGHEVCAVTTGGLDVLPKYTEFRPDVVLMDVMMPRCNGLTISHALLSRNPAVKLVLCSGAVDPNHPFIGTSGACRFLAKPFTFPQAQELLESLVASG